MPEQTVNVDLCFVPASHERAEAVPAVSGSSGRLIVSVPRVVDGQRDYPGRVFEREELSYREAMEGFIGARQEAQGHKSATGEEAGQGERELKGLRRELRAEEQRLRVETGKERERRRLIDGAWEARRQEHREALGSPWRGQRR